MHAPAARACVSACGPIESERGALPLPEAYQPQAWDPATLDLRRIWERSHTARTFTVSARVARRTKTPRAGCWAALSNAKDGTRQQPHLNAPCRRLSRESGPRKSMGRRCRSGSPRVATSSAALRRSARERIRRRDAHPWTCQAAETADGYALLSTAQPDEHGPARVT